MSPSPSHLDSSTPPIPRSLIPSWTASPIPNLPVSAAGLLALADLHTIARRTTITGGSSWLDALVLAPGLHYQQAADAADRELSAPLSAVETGPAGDAAGAVFKGGAAEALGGESAGRVPVEVRHGIVNVALANYLVGFRGEDGTPRVVTLDVCRDEDSSETLGRRLSGLVMGQERSRKKRKMAVLKQRRGPDDLDVAPNLDLLGNLLYLGSPLLTISSMVFMILFEDWWGLAFILALMLSRIINIFTIKRRCRISPPHPHVTQQQQQHPGASPAPPAPPDDPHATTTYLINIGPNSSVRLRGHPSDLQALTAQSWMRRQTLGDGYLEAAAKLLVYLVAAFSGNLSQAGGLVLMALLLSSAGLLGLSNGHVRSFRMHGRVAREERQLGRRLPG